MPVRPLFLLSLPRSGSTLLQRLLAAHDRIDTAPEPWLLLPHIYALRRRGVYAEYGHSGAVRALSDFAEGLPGGRPDYEQSLREFALGLYAKASRADALYFLDKTPRYSLIVQDLHRLFPEAKFVFLWRNPLAVVASVIETWGRGRWRMHPWRVDLYQGLASLVSAYEQMRESSLALRYEDLVGAPEPELARLYDYLGLSHDDGAVARFADTDVSGRFGDQVGTRRYGEISTDSLAKWRDTLRGPARKHWSRRYLRWIGRERLARMGYDLDALLADLDRSETRFRGTLSDLYGMAYGSIVCALDLRIVADQLASGRSLMRVHTHR